MPPLIQAVLVVLGVLTAIAAISIFAMWIGSIKDRKELKKATKNVEVLEAARKSFFDIGERIAERKRILRNLSSMLTQDRERIQKELDVLQDKQVAITAAIDKADLETLEKLIEGP